MQKKFSVLIDGGNVIVSLRRSASPPTNNSPGCWGSRCPNLFLFRGPCDRDVGAVTAEQMRDFCCLRRAEDSAKEDSKLKLADLM